METDIGLRFSEMSTRDIAADLESRLSPHRFAHTLSTAETARELAPIFGEDAERAYFAGLLHDCAKSLAGSELLKAGIAGGADAFEIANTFLLHAPAGAWLAKTRYGVSSEEILTAIRRHTVGARGMSVLDAIIFTSDFCEPERETFDGLGDVRALARKDIFAAAAQSARLSRNYAASRGWDLHPASQEMIEDIEKRRMIYG